MIISADDFGISPGVDDGILALIEKNRISSTSCMVAGQSPSLTKNLSQLKKYSTKIDVGLHLVLTDYRPRSNPNLKSGLVNNDGVFHNINNLSSRAYFGNIDSASLDAEIKAQIEYFTDCFGRPPDFIDGHQHVQQLPIIKNSVLNAAIKLNSLKYVRIANLPNRWIWNSAQSVSVRFALENYALAIPGRQSASFFTKNGIKHNRYLLGYYRHKSNIQFYTVFKHYLKLKPESQDIFFCHPGYVDDYLKRVDALVESRQDNLDFLLSAEFEDLCGRSEVEITKFTSSN